MTDFDVVIVGAGIAGASLAAELPVEMSVLLLEGEAHPGYHATGRSAAFWAESYGGPDVQPLTTASGPFLTSPPPGFSDAPLLKKRGALHIGVAGDQSHADALLNDFRTSGVALEVLGSAEIKGHVPNIRESWTLGLWEPECSDIDVAALHAAYLRQAKRRNVKLLCNAALRKAKFNEGHWALETTAGNFGADILVNAAGAWADDVAQNAGIDPIDISPYRRTVVQLVTEPAYTDNLPLVVALDGSFYFKPDSGGRIWLSPHDETLSLACDAAPEELDVALAIDRFQQVVHCKFLKVEHKWAGLRSFSPDRLPVIGRDPGNEQFVWLAGQGGFGIQTAPAVAKIATSILVDNKMPFGSVDVQKYAPERFR